MHIENRRFGALLAVLILLALLPAAALAEDLPPLVVEAPAATDAPKQVETAAFEPLKAPKGAISRYYTALRLSGYEHTVYAFTGKTGLTQFRVYGRLNKKKGMYEAQVTAQADTGGDVPTFLVEVTGKKPVKDRDTAFAVGKALKLAKADVPEGYRTTTKPGVIWFTNLFRQKEYRVLGQVQGVGDAWYPAANGRPRRGSLAIDLEQDQARFRPENGKYFKVPKEYRNGFAQSVFIFTSDGQKVSVLTDKPVLDTNKLK